MATNLVVRNVDEEITSALEQRAASHGRSVEAEHREILKATLTLPKRRPFKELLASMPSAGKDSDFNFRND